MAEVYGLELTSAPETEAIPLAAVVIAECMSADGERFLHMTSTEMPLWTQLGFVIAAETELRIGLTECWEGDGDAET